MPRNIRVELSDVKGTQKIFKTYNFFVTDKTNILYRYVRNIVWVIFRLSI